MKTSMGNNPFMFIREMHTLLVQWYNFKDANIYTKRVSPILSLSKIHTLKEFLNQFMGRKRFLLMENKKNLEYFEGNKGFCVLVKEYVLIYP